MNKAQALQATVSIFDLLDLLGIKHHGQGTYQIQCPSPTHTDTNPSARVYGGTNSVYCWTCNKTWDVVGLVREVRQLDFKGACEFLERYFGAVSFDKDPAWVLRFNKLKAKGFTSDKEVNACGSFLYAEFVNWYKKEYWVNTPQAVLEFVWYWCRVHDEIERFRVPNAEKIRLYVEWNVFGRECVKHVSHLRPEELPEWYTTSCAAAYPRAKCTWDSVPHNRDARIAGGQRLQDFRYCWRFADAARELARRSSGGGRSSGQA